MHIKVAEADALLEHKLSRNMVKSFIKYLLFDVRVQVLCGGKMTMLIGIRLWWS